MGTAREASQRHQPERSCSKKGGEPAERESYVVRIRSRVGRVLTLETLPEDLGPGTD